MDCWCSKLKVETAKMPGGKTCFFQKCKNYSTSDPNRHFVPFVKPHIDLKRCQEWIQLCGRPSYPYDSITKHSYICDEHFNLNEVLDWKLNPNQTEPDDNMKPAFCSRYFFSLKTIKKLSLSEANDIWQDYHWVQLKTGLPLEADNSQEQVYLTEPLRGQVPRVSLPNSNRSLYENKCPHGLHIWYANANPHQHLNSLYVDK